MLLLIYASELACAIAAYARHRGKEALESLREEHRMHLEDLRYEQELSERYARRLGDAFRRGQTVDELVLDYLAQRCREQEVAARLNDFEERHFLDAQERADWMQCFLRQEQGQSEVYKGGWGAYSHVAVTPLACLGKDPLLFVQVSGYAANGSDAAQAEQFLCEAGAMYSPLLELAERGKIEPSLVYDRSLLLTVLGIYEGSDSRSEAGDAEDDWEPEARPEYYARFNGMSRKQLSDRRACKKYPGGSYLCSRIDRRLQRQFKCCLRQEDRQQTAD